MKHSFQPGDKVQHFCVDATVVKPEYINCMIVHKDQVPLHIVKRRINQDTGEEVINPNETVEIAAFYTGTNITRGWGDERL